ncbi:MAG: type II secretion system protein [Planctomycetota bacterium]
MNRTDSRGYTLVELLVVVTILGLAGALVIPQMDQAGVLRSQAAMRTIIADITFAQADAVAMQEQRAIIFDPANNGYTVNEVLDATTFQPLVDLRSSSGTGEYRMTISRESYGNVQMTGAEFDGTDQMLVFDEFGAPVGAAGSNAPSAGGAITLQDDFFDFTITLEPFTGRVIASKVER